jgi:hypothetical protein
MPDDLKTHIDQMDFAVEQITQLGANQDSGEGLSETTLIARSIRELWNGIFKPLVQASM